MKQIFSIIVIVIVILTVIYIVLRLANNVYKVLLRFLMKTRIAIIDPGGEEDVDRFFNWLYSNKILVRTIEERR